MADIILDVVTSDKLERFGQQMWAAMQTWVTSNIDQSNQMNVICSNLDAGLRESVGTTGTEKAIVARQVLEAIAQALEDAGYDITGLTAEDFPDLIRSNR